MSIDDHCHCDAGHTEVNGVCVEDSETQRGPGAESSIDCGPNGTYDGLACLCDDGFTQAGYEDGQTCAAIPDCVGPDDDHEPNNEPSAGAPLPEAGSMLYACPADRDWYLFPVSAGDRVSVQIRFTHDSVDLDLVLYGPSSREPLVASFSSTSNYEGESCFARARGRHGRDPRGAVRGR